MVPHKAEGDVLVSGGQMHGMNDEQVRHTDTTGVSDLDIVFREGFRLIPVLTVVLPLDLEAGNPKIRLPSPAQHLLFSQ